MCHSLWLITYDSYTLPHTIWLISIAEVTSKTTFLRKIVFTIVFYGVQSTRNASRQKFIFFFKTLLDDPLSVIYCDFSIFYAFHENDKFTHWITIFIEYEKNIFKDWEYDRLHQKSTMLHRQSYEKSNGNEPKTSGSQVNAYKMTPWANQI